MATKYMNDTVTVRGRFLGGGLFEPRENNGKVEYSACIVLDEGEDKRVQALVNKAVDHHFDGNPPTGLLDWGVRIGEDPDFEHSYEKSFINPKAKDSRPPGVVVRNQDGTVRNVTAADGIIYPGCHVAVSVGAYAYTGSKAVKSGVTLSLRAVMFTKDGESLGSRFRSSEFEGIDSEFEDLQSLDSAELDELTS